MTQQAIGCLYGQLIGDAFGCRYEFSDAKTTCSMMEKDTNANGFVPILGGGPLCLPPGQVTDDSEMALSLAASLCRQRGLDAADVATAYVQWRATNPPDIGFATAAALTVDEFPAGASVLTLSPDHKQRIYNKVIANVMKNNGNSLSNGCLMRISPLAIAVSKSSPLVLDRAVEADCRLTHCHEACIDAVRVYCYAVGSLLNGSSSKEAYTDALSRCRTSLVKDILVTAETKAKPVKTQNGLVEGDTRCMGYIGVALQSAFFELLHANNFSDGLLSAVRRGGDTDTNGAIVGALLGAKYGVDSVPSDWIQVIKKAKPRCSELPISYEVESLAIELLDIANNFHVNDQLPNENLTEK